MPLTAGTRKALLYASAPPPSPALFTLTHRGSQASTAGAASYTVTGADLGSPSASRVVVVAFLVSSTSSTTISSVTIGGVSASAAVTTAATTRLMELWYAVVPTGSTGDIVVTPAAAGTGCITDWWTITGTSQSAPFDVSDNPSLSATSNTITTTLMSVPAGGCAIAVNFHNSTATGGETAWSISAGTVTERTDAQVGASRPWFTTADTMQVGDITFTATNAQGAVLTRIAALSWGP